VVWSCLRFKQIANGAQALCIHVVETGPPSAAPSQLFQAVLGLVSAGVFLPHGITITRPWCSECVIMRAPGCDSMQPCVDCLWVGLLGW
jgi:phage tail protein X